MLLVFTSFVHATSIYRAHYPLLLWAQHATVACMSVSVSPTLAIDAEQGALYAFAFGLHLRVF